MNQSASTSRNVRERVGDGVAQKRNQISPIFVVGCHRGGTTMLGTLLGGHPNVITIPEAQFIAELIPNLDCSAPCNTRDLIEQIERHYRFRIWNFDLGGRRPTELQLPYADTIRWIVREYARAHDREDACWWVDHQPGHVEYIARLSVHFPDLKVIHLVRDGRAIAASMLRLNWGANEIHTAAYFWQQRLAKGLAIRDFLGDEHYRMVRYEDILSKPEEQLRLLAEFIGVNYVPAMAMGGSFAVPDFTLKQHQLVGNPPDLSRMTAWKAELSYRQIEIFESIAQDLLVYLGYELTCGLNPRPLSWDEKLLLTLRHQLKSAVNAWSRRRRVRRYAVS